MSSQVDKRFLDPSAARKFYNRFGAKQDKQAFYEDKALSALEAASSFADAKHVFEFGFGTGRFARRLFENHLPEDATYTGVDVSSTMYELASRKLKRWQKRVTLKLTEGETEFDLPANSVDRFISVYVLDLLSPETLSSVLTEGRRLLTPDGLLCLVSLTNPVGASGYLTAAIWRLLFRLNPSIVGGCRPVALTQFLPESEWRITHHETVVSWTITSEILVATPLT